MGGHHANATRACARVRAGRSRMQHAGTARRTHAGRHGAANDGARPRMRPARPCTRYRPVAALRDRAKLAGRTRPDVGLPYGLAPRALVSRARERGALLDRRSTLSTIAGGCVCALAFASARLCSCSILFVFDSIGATAYASSPRIVSAHPRVRPAAASVLRKRRSARGPRAPARTFVLLQLAEYRPTVPPPRRACLSAGPGHSSEPVMNTHD